MPALHAQTRRSGAALGECCRGEKYLSTRSGTSVAGKPTKMQVDIEKVAAATALCTLAHYNYVRTYCTKKIRKSWKKRRWWMITMHKNRTVTSICEVFYELLCEPSAEFQNFTRMSYADFKLLLDKISPVITKKDTAMRKAIPPAARLAITLRFLATGDSYRSLHFLFKVSSQIISVIIPEVCEALNEALKDEVKIPTTSDEWIAIENGFKEKFPHCVGAIDGKHIVIQAPVYSGSEYYNYKKSFSIVLLALVDSNYNFTFADIGSQGRISDGGVFKNSLLWQKICTNNMNFPPAKPLPGRTKDVPYVFVGDGAFALSTHLMKPFPGNHDNGSSKREFNRRLASTRVVVENIFGVLAAKFRVFKKPLQLEPESVQLLTMTCVLLHNFLRRSHTSRQIYSPAGTFDSYNENGELVQPGIWRNEVNLNICAIRNVPQTGRRPALNPVEIREEFTSYFATNT